MPKFFKFMCFSFLGLVLPAHAEGLKTVKVCTIENFAPIVFAKGNSQPIIKEVIQPGQDSRRLTGAGFEIVKRSFALSGVTLEVHIAPAAQCLKRVENGQIHLTFPASKNAERLKKYHYSEGWVDKTGFVAYYKKDRALKWTGIESLKGLVVAKPRGWAFGNKFANFKDMKEVIEVSESIQKSFELLAKNRFDVFLGYDFVFDYELNRSPFKNQIAKTKAFDQSSEYLIGSKTNQEVLEAIKIFDAGYQKLVNSKEREKILKQYEVKF